MIRLNSALLEGAFTADQIAAWTPAVAPSFLHSRPPPLLIFPSLIYYNRCAMMKDDVVCFGGISIEQWRQLMTPAGIQVATGAGPSDQSSHLHPDLNSIISQPSSTQKILNDCEGGDTDPISHSQTNGIAKSSSPTPPPPSAPDLSWAQRVALNAPSNASPSLPAAINRLGINPPPLPVMPKASVAPPPLPVRRIRGMVNSGNTCFANVILQSLIATDDFRRYLLQARHNPVNPPLIAHFVQLAMDMSLPEDSKPQIARDSKMVPNLADVLVPDWAHDLFPPTDGAVRPSVNGTRSTRMQEDAQEFLTFILNSMHEESIDIAKKEKKEAAVVEENGTNGEWQEMARRGRVVTVRPDSVSSESAITRIFGGHIRSELKRPRAQTSVTREAFLNLSLDIKSGFIRNVNDALTQFFRAEQLEGYEQEGVAVAARKHMSIETLPSVLILHLKRFAHVERTKHPIKVGRKLEFGEYLTIPTESCYNPQAVGLREYRLDAVVTHVGKEAHGGHYLGDVRVRSGDRDIWVNCDDSKVAQIKLDAVLRRQAYLLFYSRTNTQRNS